MVLKLSGPFSSRRTALKWSRFISCPQHIHVHAVCCTFDREATLGTQTHKQTIYFVAKQGEEGLHAHRGPVHTHMKCVVSQAKLWIYVHVHCTWNMAQDVRLLVYLYMYRWKLLVSMKTAYVDMYMYNVQ